MQVLLSVGVHECMCVWRDYRRLQPGSCEKERAAQLPAAFDWTARGCHLMPSKLNLAPARESGQNTFFHPVPSLIHHSSIHPQN